MKFVHIRQFNIEGDVEGKGGTTVAYEFQAAGVVKFAVAKCRDTDNFCKATGRVKAAGKMKSPTHAKYVDKISTVDDLICYVMRNRRAM